MSVWEDSAPTGAANGCAGEVLSVADLCTKSGKPVASFGDSIFPRCKRVIVNPVAQVPTGEFGEITNM